MKYYVVTDPHGHYDALISALTEKGFFEDKSPNKLIICGDLLDRGSQTEEICNFVYDLIKKDKLILIKGNHEDLIAELVDNLEYYLEKGIGNTHHFINGTYHTLMDLTGMDHDEIFCRPQRAISRAKNSLFFKKIAPVAIDYFETERYIFTHGWIPCVTFGKGIYTTYRVLEDWRSKATEKDWYYARWCNGMDAAHCNAIESGKTVVCGHKRAAYGHFTYEGKGSDGGKNADYSPYYSKGIIALDANTYVSGIINCIVIED